jgi:hypothetical protein
VLGMDSFSFYEDEALTAGQYIFPAVGHPFCAAEDLMDACGRETVNTSYDLFPTVCG